MQSGRRPPPLPIEPSRFTQPFWEACRRGILEAASCKNCGHLFLPAGPVCPRCWSDHLDREALSGHGEIVAFTIYRQTYYPEFPAPYVLALIALKEGPRLVSNIVDCAPEELATGLRVRVRFQARGDFIAPLFAPADAATHAECKGIEQ